MTEIHGHADEGFGAVADAFADNFERHGELGAGFSLYVDGRQRVDLWGGVADRSTGEPWTDRTLQLVFSVTKGATAICVAKLVQSGQLSYDDTVARHWPEFAVNGKGDITVGQMMSHQAGLIGVDAPIGFDEIMAVTPVVESLQQQAPIWPPGTAHGYHALTYGWLAGELVRRVDGRRLGRFFADEVAAPLGLEFWIGLPESHERRVSRLESPPPLTDPQLIAMRAAVIGPGTNAHRALGLDGRVRSDGVDNDYNRRALHASEMPAVNGITNAGSVARMYAATVGEVDGVRLLDAATMEAARTERVSGPDLTLLASTRVGAGFWLHNDLAPMLQDGSFGHPGAGGSLGYANPELGIGYGYVMNQMGRGIAGDIRTLGLNAAVLACL
ncbi:MAG TPA: serine hydrolase domain-containing protein [Ilumatobacter sp.]